MLHLRYGRIVMDINLWLEKRVNKNKINALCVSINPVKARHWKREWNKYKLSEKRKKLGRL